MVDLLLVVVDEFGGVLAPLSQSCESLEQWCDFFSVSLGNRHRIAVPVRQDTGHSILGRLNLPAYLCRGPVRSRQLHWLWHDFWHDFWH